MAIIDRQSQAVRKQRDLAKRILDIYSECVQEQASFDENYKSGQGYSLDPTDDPAKVTAGELLDLGIIYDDLQTVNGQALTNFIKFIEGTEFTARNHGIDLRKIADIR